MKKYVRIVYVIDKNNGKSYRIEKCYLNLIIIKFWKPWTRFPTLERAEKFIETVTSKLYEGVVFRVYEGEIQDNTQS